MGSSDSEVRPHIGIPLQSSQSLHPVPRFPKSDKTKPDGDQDLTFVGYPGHRTSSHRSGGSRVLFNSLPDIEEFSGLERNLGSQETQHLYGVQTLQDAVPNFHLGLHKGRQSVDISGLQGGLSTCPHPPLPSKVPAVHLCGPPFSIPGHVIGPQDLHKTIGSGSGKHQTNSCKSAMLFG